MSEQQTSLYGQWIAEHVPEPRGRCAEATTEMVAAFPELRRVRGHYWNPYINREVPHWWCVASDGTVVDPTAAQFPCAWMGDYTEHVGHEPTGKCPNCSGYVYDGGTVCSDACARQYEAYCLGRSI